MTYTLQHSETVIFTYPSLLGSWGQGTGLAMIQYPWRWKILLKASQRQFGNAGAWTCDLLMDNPEPLPLSHHWNFKVTFLGQP